MSDFSDSAWGKARDTSAATAARLASQEARRNDAALEAFDEDPPPFPGATFIGFYLGDKAGLRRDRIFTIQVPASQFHQALPIAMVARGTPLLFDVTAWDAYVDEEENEHLGSD